MVKYMTRANNLHRAALNRGSVGAGVAVIFYETFLVAHVHDINQPDLSYFANSESRLPRTYSFLAGRVFSLQ